MTEPTKYESSKNPRAAGIMNLIGAGLCLIGVVALFACMYGGVIGKDAENDVESGVGFAVSVIVFLPFLLITFVPLCVTDAVWQTVFGIKLLRTGRPLSRGFYVTALILKILSALVFAFDSILIYGLADAGGSKLLAGILAAAFLLLAVYQIVVGVVERKERKKRID